MRGLGPIAIALIGGVAFLSFVAIFFNTAIGKTVFFSIVAKETEIIRAVNRIEVVKTGLPYALEYSFYQAVYDVSKNGGYYYVPSDIPTYNNLPVWRRYDKTYEPDYVNEVEKSTLSYLNRYASSVKTVSIPAYTSVELGVVIHRYRFVCCSPCKCDECKYHWRAGLERCYCNSECENRGDLCRSSFPGDSTVECIPKSGTWYAGSCPGGLKKYDARICEHTAKTNEEACKEKCKKDGYTFLGYDRATRVCTCELIETPPRELSINAFNSKEMTVSSEFFTASDNPNTSTIIKTNLLKVQNIAEKEIIYSDAIGNKLSEEMSSFNCNSDNETIKSRLESVIPLIGFSDDTLTLSLSVEKLIFKPDCNSTAAAIVEVKITDKLKHPVYDGATAYRNPQLHFFVITSSDYSFQPV